MTNQLTSQMRLLLPLVFLVTSGFCQEIVGRVVSIADGDTFTMLFKSEQVKIRLHGIDCPERGQDFSNTAREFLADLVFGKDVVVRKMDTDRYGRTIGMVFIDGINVNERLLGAGLAWHYKSYDNNSEWSQLENQARDKRAGLWSHPNPIPPWEYRKGRR
jgi:micrococcal nuclease